jgi:5'-methylthioadenosine phosphorylase
MIKIGIIGGSGLENPDILEGAQKLSVETPYGDPSSSLTLGKINGVNVVLLSRHGSGHAITPTGVNNRANIYALKEIGCTHIIVTTACGSLREEIGRGDLVILDQFIDFTKHRALTFFDEFPGDGAENAQHIAMAEPFSEDLRKVLIETARELNIKHHESGTVITIEGNRFSTRAESKMFKSWGADVINMSVAPECILANEAGLPYAAIAMATDYDSWKADEDSADWSDILKVFSQNVERATRLLIRSVSKVGGDDSIKSKIRTIANWPKDGVMFRDITTLLKDPEGLKICIDNFYDHYKDVDIDVIASMDARGFILGSVLAYKLGVGFVPIRKKGKLPAEVETEEYMKEYGPDELSIHKDAIETGQRVLIIDDLLATGGTALASARLVEKVGGQIVELAFIVDLPDLGGSQKLKEAGHSIYFQTNFEGE